MEKYSCHRETSVVRCVRKTAPVGFRCQNWFFCSFGFRLSETEGVQIFPPLPHFSGVIFFWDSPKSSVPPMSVIYWPNFMSFCRFSSVPSWFITLWKQSDRPALSLPTNLLALPKRHGSMPTSSLVIWWWSNHKLFQRARRTLHSCRAWQRGASCTGEGIGTFCVPCL